MAIGGSGIVGDVLAVLPQGRHGAFQRETVFQSISGNFELRRDVTEHPYGDDLLRSPRLSGMPQKAELKRDTKPIRYGPASGDEFPVGRRQRVERFELSKSYRKRQ